MEKYVESNSNSDMPAPLKQLTDMLGCKAELQFDLEDVWEIFCTQKDRQAHYVNTDTGDWGDRGFQVFTLAGDVIYVGTNVQKAYDAITK